MALRPCRDDRTLMRGIFEFRAVPVNGSEICDQYELELEIPSSFPKALPKVKEVGGKIPRDGDFHVNYDNTLCLGSPLKLFKKVSECPTIAGYAAKCIVPYLYAVSYKLRHGGSFVFSELAHGKQGVLDDYLRLLDLRSPGEVLDALELLGIKRRIANKLACPCKCGERLGSCNYHNKLNQFRKLTSRSWFKSHHRMLGAGELL